MEINFSEVDVENITQSESNSVPIDVDLGSEPGTNPVVEAAAAAETIKPDTEKKPEEVDPNLVEVNDTQEAQENASAPVQSLNNSSTPSPYKLFGKALYNEGVLSVFDEEKVDSLEDLQDAVAQTIDAEIDAYKQSLPEAVRKIVEHAERTGEVNLDTAIKTQKEYLEVTGITEASLRKDVTLQEKILMEELVKVRKYTEVRAKRYVDNVKASDQLEEESVDALTSVKEAKAQEAQELERKTLEQQDALEKQRETTLASLKKDIETTTELVPGVKLTKKEQDAIYASITTPVATDNNGNPLNAVAAARSKNPIAFEKMLHYLYSKGVFNIDATGNINPDWTFVTKGIKSEVAKKTQQTIGGGFHPGSPSIPNSGNDDLLAALKQKYQ